MIPATGGAVTTLTRLSTEWHEDPQVLPGSDVVVYHARAVSRVRIEAISLDGKRRKPILENASRPRYLASGHLLFMRDGGLMVAPFDKGRLEITGPVVPVPLEVAVDSPLAAAPVPQLAVSSEGTLVYVPFPAESLRSSTLVWVDRKGAVEDVGTLPFAHPFFALSPDHGRLAVSGRERGNARIDLYDLSRRASTRLVEREVDWPTGPVFSRDGRRLFVGNSEMERSELLSLPVDGGGKAERVLTVPGLILTPTSVSADGRFVAFYVFDKKSSGDVWIADLEGQEGQRARPFLVGPDHAYGATFSPSGRLLAYTSSESGENHVYVRRFPEGDAKTRVSIEAGQDPQWSQDGTELFYQSPDGKKLMAVPVRQDHGLSFGAPRVLFEGPYLASDDIGFTYAVSPDARRFLMTRQPSLAPLRASELVVVQNWVEDVRRLTGDRRLP